MRLPPDLEQTFEPYLRRKLDSTRALKKRFQTRRTADLDTPAHALELACGQSLEGLLASIQRKTTPLYVRLIHGAVEFFLDANNADQFTAAAKITDSVAATMGLEKLRIQEAWLESSD